MSTHLDTQKKIEAYSSAVDINNNSDVSNNDVVIFETISDPVTSLWPLTKIWDFEYFKRFTTGNNNTKKWQCHWCLKSGYASSEFSSHNAKKCCIMYVIFLAMEFAHALVE